MPGPFTVFAPTDEAFAKLPPGVLDTLMKTEHKAALEKMLGHRPTTGIVTLHALSSRVSVVKMSDGLTVTLKKQGGNSAMMRRS